MHEKQSGIQRAPDKEDSKQAALYGGEVTLLSPRQDMQIVMPDYRRNPPPPYPDIARRRGHQGNVIVEALVNQEGRTDEILLLQSSGHNSLDRAAIASVKKWSFEPGRKGGETVQMWVKVRIGFQLK